MLIADGSYRNLVNTQRRGNFESVETNETIPNFLNFTDLPLSEAKDWISHLYNYVVSGESYSADRLKKGARAQDIRNGKIWSKDDEEFFADLDLSAYEFNIQRPLFNKLFEDQFNETLRFSVQPFDDNAYYREVSGKENFVQKNLDKFASPEEAEEYYIENIDDAFGMMISAMITNARRECQAKYEESEAFDDGSLTGLSFLKAKWSTRFNREGGEEIEFVPQNAIGYDEPRSTRYDISDIEFIFQVHDYYPEDLIQEYPKYKKQIEGAYQYLVENKTRLTPLSTNAKQDWANFYKYENNTIKIKVVEMWSPEMVEKMKVTDKQTGKVRIAKDSVTMDQVYDKLLTDLTRELYEGIQNSPNARSSDINIFNNPNLKGKLTTILFKRYKFEKIYEKEWVKTVFTFNGLFEHQPSPYPDHKHPFVPYFAQFNHGQTHGLVEDVLDVIIAYNKAVAFRELMMAHGAKNVLLVDEDMLADNDIKKEDIADQWTRIGSVIALHLKPGTRMSDVAVPVNTVGSQMEFTSTIIQHYSELMYEITGITPAQLGNTNAEDSATKYNEIIKQGKGNNGLIFRNFHRTLELLYKKIMSMEVMQLKAKRQRVIPLLGDEYKYFFNSNFLNVEWNDDFETFEYTLRDGLYGFELVPEEDNPHVNNAREGYLMELGANQVIPIELAFKYSTWSKRHQFIRDLHKQQQRQMLRQIDMSVDVQELRVMMAKYGIDSETAQKMLDEIHLQNSEKLRDSQNTTLTNKPNLQAIKNAGAQMQRPQRIQQATMQGKNNNG